MNRYALTAKAVAGFEAKVANLGIRRGKDGKVTGPADFSGIFHSGGCVLRFRIEFTPDQT